MLNTLRRIFGGESAAAKPLAGLTLYHFPTCPFCVRVRLALERMGISLESRNVNRDRQALAELIEGGGKSQVPCLRIEEAGSVRWLYESADIIDFLHRHVGEAKPV